MLEGIDVSSHQGDINVAAVPSDFVIIKATGGTGYVNEWCDPIMQKAIAAGKRKGVYHFRDDGYGYASPIAEADFFIDNITGYLDGRTLLVLDWEAGDLSDTNWVLQWCNRVFERTGVKPLVYMSEWVENTYDWSAVVAADYGLWIAKYSTQEPTLRHWPFYIMWQYTSSKRLAGYSGDLDHNHFYGDANVWDAYCRSQNNVSIPEVPAADKTPETPVATIPDTPAPVTPSPVVTGPVEPAPNQEPPAPVPTPENNPVRTKVKWGAIAGVVLSFLISLVGFISDSPELATASGAAWLVTIAQFVTAYMKKDGYSPKEEK